MAQVAYPPCVVQDVNWTSGTHYVGVSPAILSPASPGHPVAIGGEAVGEFVSGTEVRLTKGFHAGGFSGNGYFRAWVDESLYPGAVALIAPDSATHISGNMLHVNKWEKLELGIQLPPDYQEAIDRFFAHYYSDPLNSFFATPGNVDPVHDLNPYADDSLHVVMTLTKPDGTQTLKWGFFMREAKWSGISNASLPVEASLDLLYPYAIRFRLSPDTVGTWQFSFAIQAPQTRTLTGDTLAPLNGTGYTFVCEPPLPDNHGPLRVNATNRRTLQFEDGTPYFGLGTNFSLVTGHGNGWWDMDGYRLTRQSFTEATDAMQALQSVGGNFVRVFLGNRTFSPEYVNLGVYDRYHESLGCAPGDTPIGTGNYQNNCWAFDQLLDSARNAGIYLQACIKPYPPIVAYETWGWHNDAYLNSFVLPRDTLTNLFDMKRYFYSEGDTANTSSGAFYYWKRRYKYLLSRWGWSVNLPIIEPFNEIDQMLTYRHVDMTHYPNDLDCPANNLDWPADPALPATYSQWLTDLITYVKGDQDLNDPVHSPLGYGDKLFLTGTGPEDNNNPDWEEPNNPNWNLPNKNPNVDLVDLHHGMFWGDDQLAKSYTNSQSIRDAYTNSANGAKRPFHQGEYNYYQLVDINPIDTVTDWYDAALIFDNYDISFHNELWASTFFGNFASGSTWQMGRVFWWEDALPTPPPDANNPWYGQYPRTAALSGINALQLPNDPTPPLLVENRTLYHHLKPLSGFLEEVAIEPGGFFEQLHTPRKVYDDVSGLECYYLTNADSTMAIGWVHNLNAYWEKHYYVKNNPAMQNYLGCTPPNAQAISLPGLQAGIDYRVSWYPTRMNMTALPAILEDSTRTGTVILDLASLPFNGIYSWPANDNLDTLHSDYAFLIEPLPEHRMVPAGNEASLLANEYDFGLYPNPANGFVNVVLPTGPAVDLVVLDVAGRRLIRVAGLTEGVHTLNLEHLVPGAYGICITSPGDVGKTKLLIKR
ncbi:MAG: T9SS type A sorting domain-containing protein [Flavobacteriales bacterium]|nr:T9SS type A sorting domain-containing protein [Flavobacteriales bacterium]